MTGIWSRPTGSVGYDSPDYWEYFGLKLAEYGTIESGAKVLDVGCGTGSSLFPAAEQAGTNGFIIGIDICPH